MRFETLGDRKNPAALFFHAMGVTGESSEPVAKHMQDKFFCILPTSTVYCAGQKYAGKEDEVRQIEDFLRRFDKLKDVAVIGLPDPRLGEIAAAIVEVKEGVTCTQEEIQAFCRELPRYKRPRKIIFDKVPRNPTGKIEKPALREKYCHGRLVEAQINS